MNPLINTPSQPHTKISFNLNQHSKFQASFLKKDCQEVLDTEFNHQRQSIAVKSSFLKRKEQENVNWFKKIKLTSNLRRFLSNLSNNTRVYGQNKLSEYHLDIINDQVSFRKGCKTTAQHLQQFRSQNQNQNKNSQSLVSKLLFHVKSTYEVFEMFFTNQSTKISKLPVIQPMGAVYFCWQLIQLTIIIHNFIQFPLLQSFREEIINQYYSILYKFFVIEATLFILDLIINCNIAVLDKGNLLTQRSQIIWKYINKPKRFLLDIVGFIGFLFQYSWIWYKDDALLFTILQYLFMIKAFKLMSISKKIDKAANFSGAVKGYINLFKLFFFIFLVAHFLCCFQYNIAQYSLEYYEENLLTGRVIHSWFDAYIYTIYFILMTMTTIGYGDIVPKNPIEMFYTLFVMLICSALFGYTLNGINQIFDELKNNTETYRKQKKIIIDYMYRRGISKETQMRVKNYLKNVYQNGMLDNMEQEESILQSLSIALKDDIVFEDKGKALIQIPLFKNNFSQKFIRRISGYMKEIYYSPGDIIDSQEDKNLADNSLCYIQKGSISYQPIESSKKIQSLSQGEYFGLINILTGDGLNADIISEDFTILYCLNYNEFINVIKEPDFKDDYETYCMLRDKLLVGNDDLNYLCYSCGLKNHLSIQCPLISYVPNKEFIIIKQQKSIPLQRQIHKRNRSKVNTFKKLKKNQDSIIKFQLLQNQLDNLNISQNSQSQNLIQIDKLNQHPRRQSNRKCTQYTQFNKVHNGFNAHIKKKAYNSAQLTCKSNNIDDESAKNNTQIIEYGREKDLKLEKYQSMKKYFPRFNIDNVLQVYNSQQKKKKSKIIRKL